MFSCCEHVCMPDLAILNEWEIFYHVSLEHRCDKNGCGSVIVLDGNMKNHRSVCLATHADILNMMDCPELYKLVVQTHLLTDHAFASYTNQKYLKAVIKVHL